MRKSSFFRIDVYILMVKPHFQKWECRFTMRKRIVGWLNIDFIIVKWRSRKFEPRFLQLASRLHDTRFLLFRSSFYHGKINIQRNERWYYLGKPAIGLFETSFYHEKMDVTKNKSQFPHGKTTVANYKRASRAGERRICFFAKSLTKNMDMKNYRFPLGKTYFFEGVHEGSASKEFLWKAYSLASYLQAVFFHGVHEGSASKEFLWKVYSLASYLLVFFSWCPRRLCL